MTWCIYVINLSNTWLITWNVVCLLLIWKHTDAHTWAVWNGWTVLILRLIVSNWITMIRSALDRRGYGQISHKSLQFRRVIWPVWETSGLAVRLHLLTHMQCAASHVLTANTPHTHGLIGWSTLTGSPEPCEHSLSLALSHSLYVPSYKYREYKRVWILYYSHVCLKHGHSQTHQRHLNPIKPWSRLHYFLLCGSLPFTTITLSSRHTLRALWELALRLLYNPQNTL